MDIRQRSQAVADAACAPLPEGVGAGEVHARVAALVYDALDAAITEASQAHVKITQDGTQIRIDIDKAYRPEAALILMAQAIEIVRVRVVAEMVHDTAPRIVLPGGTQGGAVNFRVGRVGDKAK